MIINKNSVFKQHKMHKIGAITLGEEIHHETISSVKKKKARV